MAVIIIKAVSYTHLDVYKRQPVDTVADEPLRVRYNVPQINEEFAEICRILWRHAQVNLLDVTVDEVGILTPSLLYLSPIT